MDKKGFTLIGIIVAFAVLIIAAGGVVVWREQTTPKQGLAPTPTSIPTFVPEVTPSPKPTSISKNGCIVWGCNGELCIDEDRERFDTICLELPWHKCFRTATCERQTDGRCAFTQTPELKDCLNKFKN